MSPRHARPEPDEPDHTDGPDPAGGEAVTGDPAAQTPATSGPAVQTPAVPDQVGPDAVAPEPNASEPAPSEPAPSEPAAPTGAAADAVTPTTPHQAAGIPASPAEAVVSPAPGRRSAQPSRATARRRPRRGRTGGPRVRSRWMWLVLGLLGVVLLAWIVLSTQGSDPSVDPQPSASATGAAQQGTLLIQVLNDDDLAADNLVAGADGGLPAAQLLVPSRLIVDVPGAGQQTLGQSARLIDRSASQDALSDLLALRIDGTLTLSRLALTAMVDFVGGITVTVDEAVTQTDPATGTQTVVVPAGTQHLNGTQAAAYALAWLPGEPEAARLARYSTVMTETIGALPDDQVQVEQMLTSLGSSARTTTATSQVAAFLLQLRAGILDESQQVRVLPTTDIEAGEDLAVVRVDLPAAQAVLESLLPTAMLDSGQARTRVLVQNGVGTPGLGASARDRLVGAGMVFINGGNAESFDVEKTQVIVTDSGADAAKLGADVAEALGVPSSAVVTTEDGQNVADVVVVLGADFQP